MRLGIISDIHGNLDALLAVVAAAGAVDGWICLGDIVGYGPQPNECVRKVQEICGTALIGNHDLVAIGRMDPSWFNSYARDAAEWTQQRLSPESRLYLESLPETYTAPEWDATFSHGSLTDPPRDYVTSRYEARKSFNLMTTRSLFIGHSHLSHCFTMEEGETYCDEEVFHGRARLELRPGFRYIVNCGSVGQPRDGDPRAAYGIFDTDEQIIHVARVKYDIESVQEKIRAAQLPSMLADRLERGA